MRWDGIEGKWGEGGGCLRSNTEARKLGLCFYTHTCTRLTCRGTECGIAEAMRGGRRLDSLLCLLLSLLVRVAVGTCTVVVVVAASRRTPFALLLPVVLVFVWDNVCKIVSVTEKFRGSRGLVFLDSHAQASLR